MALISIRVMERRSTWRPSGNTDPAGSTGAPLLRWLSWSDLIPEKILLRLSDFTASRRRHGALSAGGSSLRRLIAGELVTVALR